MITDDVSVSGRVWYKAEHPILHLDFLPVRKRTVVEFYDTITLPDPLILGIAFLALPLFYKS